MPRIFGLNIIAVLVAGIALWFIGALFYGVLFADLWMGLWGFGASDEAEKYHVFPFLKKNEPNT